MLTTEAMAERTTVREELIEAVARALHEHEESWNDHAWEHVPPGTQELFIGQAKAALAVAIPAVLEMAATECDKRIEVTAAEPVFGGYARARSLEARQLAMNVRALGAKS